MENFFGEPVLIISRLNGYTLTANKGQGTLITTLAIDLMNPLQRFEFTQDNYIQVWGTQNVFDIQDERNDAGAPIITYPKNGQPNQKWVFLTPGYIQSKMNGTIMDISKEDVKETATIITYKHQGTLNQLWEVVLVEDLTREKLEIINRRNSVIRSLGYNDFCLEIEIVNKSTDSLTDPELWIEEGTADSICGCDRGERTRSRLYGSSNATLESVLSFYCGKYRLAVSMTMEKHKLFGSRRNLFNVLFIPLQKGSDEELYQSMKISESSTTCVTKDDYHQITGSISQGNKALLHLEFK